MQKISAIALAIGLSVSAFSGAALAAPGHSGGGGGHSSGFSHSGGGHGGHSGGHGHGGYHGDGYHHGHGYYGYGLGLGLGLGLGAYYGSPYWDGGYGAYDYPDADDDGDYSDAGPPPPDGNVPPPPPDSTGPGGTPYWYHCSSPEGYYPYVKSCRNWEPVPATPPQNLGD